MKNSLSIFSLLTLSSALLFSACSENRDSPVAATPEERSLPPLAALAIDPDSSQGLKEVTSIYTRLNKILSDGEKSLGESYSSMRNNPTMAISRDKLKKIHGRFQTVTESYPAVELVQFQYEAKDYHSGAKGFLSAVLKEATSKKESILRGDLDLSTYNDGQDLFDNKNPPALRSNPELLAKQLVYSKQVLARDGLKKYVLKIRPELSALKNQLHSLEKILVATAEDLGGANGQLVLNIASDIKALGTDLKKSLDNKQGSLAVVLKRQDEMDWQQFLQINEKARLDARAQAIEARRAENALKDKKLGDEVTAANSLKTQTQARVASEYIPLFEHYLRATKVRDILDQMSGTYEALPTSEMILNFYRGTDSHIVRKNLRDQGRFEDSEGAAMEAKARDIRDLNKLIEGAARSWSEAKRKLEMKRTELHSKFAEADLSSDGKQFYDFVPLYALHAEFPEEFKALEEVAAKKIDQEAEAQHRHWITNGDTAKIQAFDRLSKMVKMADSQAQELRIASENTQKAPEVPAEELAHQARAEKVLELAKQRGLKDDLAKEAAKASRIEAEKISTDERIKSATSQKRKDLIHHLGVGRELSSMLKTVREASRLYDNLNENTRTAETLERYKAFAKVEAALESKVKANEKMVQGIRNSLRDLVNKFTEESIWSQNTANRVNRIAYEATKDPTFKYRGIKDLSLEEFFPEEFKNKNAAFIFVSEQLKELKSN